MSSATRGMDVPSITVFYLFTETSLPGLGLVSLFSVSCSLYLYCFCVFLTPIALFLCGIGLLVQLGVLV
ncbi:hypothetical protein EV363DRAFT_1354998 [Boletus edulis]|nr:hypothetical protein EV363DRAFT_1354998 [Boletus edulis]